MILKLKPFSSDFFTLLNFIKNKRDRENFTPTINPFPASHLLPSSVKAFCF